MQAYEVVFSRAAAGDIEALRDRIEIARSAKVGDAFVERLLEYIKTFSLAPQRGTLRNDIRAGVRIVGWKRTASVAFLIEPSRVVIIAVAYGGRDVEALSKQRLP